jgi:hypothetical protein
MTLSAPLRCDRSLAVAIMTLKPIAFIHSSDDSEAAEVTAKSSRPENAASHDSPTMLWAALPYCRV